MPRTPSSSMEPSYEQKPNLFCLPDELLRLIFSFSSTFKTLLVLQRTCKRLLNIASDDALWKSLINQGMAEPLRTPAPFKSFRELYATHYPYWFLVTGRLWVCEQWHENAASGILIGARYDHRKGTVEAYQLVTVRQRAPQTSWAFAPTTVVQQFQPEVSLHLYRPVIRLEKWEQYSTLNASPPRPRFGQECIMDMNAPGGASLALSFVNKSDPGWHTMQDIEAPFLWPPKELPARIRIDVRRREASLTAITAADDIDHTAFKMREWVKFSVPSPIFQSSYWFANVPNETYQPTERKPYQGLWVGDYSGHGCEFILIRQLPALGTYGDVSGTTPSADKIDTFFNAAQPDPNGNYNVGMLQALKLTGDGNIPRGKVTFEARDISTAGVLRVAHEEPFTGARIVGGRGQIAAFGYRQPTWIETQLILISHDELAMYWKILGHVTYFKRVNVDEVLRI